MSREDVSTTRRLMELKQRAQRDSERVTRLEGRRDQLLDQLKREFGISSLDEARKKLKTLTADLSRREERVQRLISDLEAEYAKQTEGA